MLLAVNIGNSNITLGVFDTAGKLRFSARIYSDSLLSSDELSYKLHNALELYDTDPDDITDVILSSVVPLLTTRMREALHKLTPAARVTEVGPGLKSGVRIRMDNPASLGGELLCAVVGALQFHTPPMLVVNMDTATTILAVDEQGSMVGGAILPGPQLSLSALVKGTAQLPQVELDATPRRLLCSNTADCLQSGIVYGTAAMLDGMAAKCRADLGAPAAPIVITGNLPASVRAACETQIDYRETLILTGLYVIWQKNRHPAVHAG